MAKATRTSQVTLTMSEDEAQTLRDIFGMVGGDPDNSRRRNSDSMHEALLSAGIRRRPYHDMSGGITFSEEQR